MHSITDLITASDAVTGLIAAGSDAPAQGREEGTPQWVQYAVAGAALLLVGGALRRPRRSGHRELARALSGRRSVTGQLIGGTGKAIGATFRYVGRFLGGREMWGGPRSNASWWRPGTIVSGGPPAAELGAIAAPGPASDPLTWERVHGAVRSRAVSRWRRHAKRPAPPALRKAAHGAAVAAGHAWRLLAATGASLSVVGRGLGAWHRWRYAGRSAARLGALATVYGLHAAPGITWAALGAVVPAGLALAGWRGTRRRPDSETYMPGLWPALVQVLRLSSEEQEWGPHHWVSFPDDIKADGAAIVIRLPLGWVGSDGERGLMKQVIHSRVPGDWTARYEQRGDAPYVRWTPTPPPKPAPEPPTMVDWLPSPDPLKVMLGETADGPYYVSIGTQTPHWGVCGGTNDGKTTCLLIACVHARQHGHVVDLFAPKTDAFDDVEGESGIRIHKSSTEMVSALAEFFVSMKSAERLPKNANGDRVLPDGTVAPYRFLVIDEWGGFMLAARGWWKHGIKGKGASPFDVWFHTIVMQARSARHFIVVGAHQFSLAMFGSTEVRDLVGTKMAVGPASPSKKLTTFPGTEVPDWNDKVKGRGAVGITGSKKAQEIQIAYVTPHAREFIAACDPAPEWFDKGRQAPWILEDVVWEATRDLMVGEFLPGGEYMPEPEALTPDTDAAGTVPNPRSEGVTDTDSAPALTSGVTPAAPETPPLYTLRQACELGILPIGYGAARQRKSVCLKEGREFPEGISNDTATHYTAEELTDWWEAEQEAAKARNAARKGPGGDA